MMRGAVVALLLITFAWLSERRAFAAEQDKAEPILERSEDLEMALRAFDFDVVRVFTWRGGLLRGKINLQDGDNIKPVDLEERITREAKVLLLKGESFDPKTMRGALVLTIKKPAGNAAKEWQCRVSIAIKLKTVSPDGKEGLGGGRQFVIQGRVPHAPDGMMSFGKTIAREWVTPEGGKKFMLYELELSPSKPARSGQDEKPK